MGGAGERNETKSKKETKEGQTRNNKTQSETQAMLNGNERRDRGWSGIKLEEGRDRMKRNM